MGKCQAAVAEAVEAFGRVDILFCCTSEGMCQRSTLNIEVKKLRTDDPVASIAVIGTVEELAASPSTLTLIRDQFETNFFGAVNIIKAALPAMRERKSGHIIVLSGISAF